MPTATSRRQADPKRRVVAGKDEEDRKAFEQAMAGVRPLKADGKIQPSSQPKATRRPNDPGQRESLARVPTDTDVALDRTEGSEVQFSRPGLQRKIFRRLKRGDFPIEDKLDLHGLYARQAEQALEDFVHDALLAGARCVLVVHGKGTRSGQPGGVLKPLTHNWLRSVPQVLAFCSAMPPDGGTGAVYVLLKRDRPD